MGGSYPPPSQAMGWMRKQAVCLRPKRQCGFQHFTVIPTSSRPSLRRPGSGQSVRHRQTGGCASAWPAVPGRRRVGRWRVSIPVVSTQRVHGLATSNTTGRCGSRSSRLLRRGLPAITRLGRKWACSPAWPTGHSGRPASPHQPADKGSHRQSPAARPVFAGGCGASPINSSWQGWREFLANQASTVHRHARGKVIAPHRRLAGLYRADGGA